MCSRGDGNFVNPESSVYLDESNADSASADLSIALIGPDEDSRKALARVISGCQGSEIHEYSSYLASLDDLPKLLDRHFDVIIIDLDSHPEYAFELVENICAKGSATVMVYSARSDSELLVRCMRAGAREFLTSPFAKSTVAEALIRASARHPAPRPRKKASGRLLAFLGAKGGDGVTTLACNFAVALAQESSQRTLLIDLDLPLGDAALNLGVVAEYSTINALQNASRLDSAFLSKLLVKHVSGVSVLAAPGKFPQYDASNEAIEKLLTVARQEFENVVIDMGSRHDLMGTGLFKEGSTVYLVIQAVIAGLRNSNRLISQYFNDESPKLEIVLNRYQPRSMGVAEDQITKALTRPAQWKIPNDFAAVRRMQHTAVPLALEDSPISRLIRQMARCSCGLPPVQEKSSGFSLKKISRSITSKISSSEEAPAFPQLDLSQSLESTAEPLPMSRIESESPAEASSISVRTSSAEAGPDKETQLLLAAKSGESPAETTLPEEEEPRLGAAHEKLSEPETRIFMGAAFVKGADGSWHLQQPEAGEAERAPFVSGEEPIAKLTPEIDWFAPEPIVYGTALGSYQLNAVAEVPGALSYVPAAGEMLQAGVHTLSVTFTPEDCETYSVANSTVEITVTKATPVIAWPAPAQIAYGTALGSDQLNAVASIPGSFQYQPGTGEVLVPGIQTLSAAFTPEDKANYKSAVASVSVTVNLVTPAISWPVPADVVYGTALSIAQLNATSPVPGSFSYRPRLGEVLPAGQHRLSVSFKPKDTVAYRTAGAAVSLVVNKATPIIAWPLPAAISYGAALGAAQLNATARVPGTMIYTPGMDEVLSAGAHTLQVTFMPADLANYTTAQATVPITVTKSESAASWASGSALFGKSVGVSDYDYEPEYTPAKATPSAARRSAVQPRQEAANAEPKPPAKATANAPAKTAVKVAEEPVRKHQVRGHGRAAEEPVVQPTPRPRVRLAEKQTAGDETPTNALIKVGAPHAPIEVGPGLDLMGSAVLEDGTTIYLVVQPGSAGMVNSSRLVSQLFSAKGPRFSFDLNRFNAECSERDGESSSWAGPRWAAGFRRQIARLTAGVSSTAETQPKKSGFSLRGLGRSIWSRIATPGRAPSMTKLGLEADQGDANAKTSAFQPEATQRFTDRPVYAHPDASLFAPADRSYIAETAHGQVSRATAHEQPQTRTYMGATYVKNDDGQWRLQDSDAGRYEGSAIPLPSSLPATGAARLQDEFRGEWDNGVSALEKRVARKVKAAPKKTQTKITSKKTAAKPAAKLAVQGSAKEEAKAAAPKYPAKRLADKASENPAEKATNKPAARTAEERTTKAAAETQERAPVQKAAPAKRAKKATGKPAAKTAPARLLREEPVPELEKAMPLQEFPSVQPITDIVKES